MVDRLTDLHPVQVVLELLAAIQAHDVALAVRLSPFRDGSHRAGEAMMVAAEKQVHYCVDHKRLFRPLLSRPAVASGRASRWRGPREQLPQRDPHRLLARRLAVCIEPGLQFRDRQLMRGVRRFHGDAEARRRAHLREREAGLFKFRDGARRRLVQRFRRDGHSARQTRAVCKRNLNEVA